MNKTITTSGIRLWCKKYGLKILVILLVLSNMFFLWMLRSSKKSNEQTIIDNTNTNSSSIHDVDDNSCDDTCVHESVETCINGVCKHYDDSHPLSDKERRELIKQIRKEHLLMMKEFKQMDAFFKEQERIFDHYFYF